MVNIMKIINSIKAQSNKRSHRSGSKKVPRDGKPSTKCGNTGMMPPTMVEIRRKPCANRGCPLCIL